MPTSMTRGGAEAFDAVYRLHAGLAGLATALETAQLAEILESESTLSHALASLGEIRGRVDASQFDAADAAALRHELGRVSALVGRCTALGRALDDIVRNRCGITGYGASGEAIAPRVHATLDRQV